MWEKFSDYSLDVSKYFITAMLVTALLGDIVEMRWLVYAISIGVGCLFFGLVSFLIEKLEESVKRNEKSIKGIKIKNGGHKYGCIICFRYDFSIFWSEFCYSFVSEGTEVDK